MATTTYTGATIALTKGRRRGSRKPAPTVSQFTVPSYISLARRLDMEADCELAQGHHAAAERLAIRAAELRGIGV